MSDKYRVGQKVRVIKAFYRQDLIGQVVTITTPKRLGRFRDEFRYSYEVSAKPRAGFRAVAFPEDWIEPVYDGDQKSSWEECAWKPITVKEKS